MEQRYYYIYIITNTITQKSYVGSRFYEYNEPYFGSSVDLDIDISTYGLWNFSKEIIGIYPYINKTERGKREGDNMELFDTFYPNGYNKYDTRKRIGFNNYGTKASLETKQKMSISGKGKHNKPLSEKHKQKISLATKGRSLSEEHKIKIGKKHKGKVISIETRQKISASRKGQSPANKGIPRTEEEKTKMSNAAKNQKRHKCIYCGFESINGIITRYHNENCKHKPLN